MSKNTITITSEQFNNAVAKANDNWMSICHQAEATNPMTMAMMSMQNIVFAIELFNVLFVESEDEE